MILKHQTEYFKASCSTFCWLAQSQGTPPTPKKHQSLHSLHCLDNFPVYLWQRLPPRGHDSILHGGLLVPNPVLPIASNTEVTNSNSLSRCSSLSIRTICISVEKTGYHNDQSTESGVDSLGARYNPSKPRSPHLHKKHKQYNLLLRVVKRHS